jgi:hypothetical protein
MSAQLQGYSLLRVAKMNPPTHQSPGRIAARRSNRSENRGAARAPRTEPCRVAAPKASGAERAFRSSGGSDFKMRICSGASAATIGNPRPQWISGGSPLADSLPLAMGQIPSLQRNPDFPMCATARIRGPHRGCLYHGIGNNVSRKLDCEQPRSTATTVTRPVLS